MLDIDINGTEKFLKIFPEANTLFIFPPSIQDLKQRLEDRKTETEATMRIRLRNATSEVEKALKTDETKNLIGFKIINRDISTCTELFVKFVE